VRSFRNYSNIAVYRKGEWAERGEITLEAAAEIIGVAKMTVLRMTSVATSRKATMLSGSSRLMIWPFLVPKNNQKGR
jgi:hypothetical protein